MGVSAASYQGTYSPFEPPAYGKVQLGNTLASFSTSIDVLAKLYKKLGDAYHDLPLHIRNHVKFPKELRELASNAFTVSDSREIPDMIQILNQLRENFARVRAGIICDELALAGELLWIAAWLVNEAEQRVADLTWGMACYEEFVESIKDSSGVQAYCILVRQASVGAERAVMKARWLDALPKSLQGK